MSVGLYVVIHCVLLFVAVITYAMLARAVMSWFFMEGENRFVNFLYVVTEPVVLPVRALFRALHWFEGMPFDMASFVTILLLTFLRVFLSSLIS